jgi:hypothetical protein
MNTKISFKQEINLEIVLIRYFKTKKYNTNLHLIISIISNL